MNKIQCHQGNFESPVGILVRIVQRLKIFYQHSKCSLMSVSSKLVSFHRYISKLLDFNINDADFTFTRIRSNMN